MLGARCAICGEDHHRDMRCTPLDEDELQMLRNLKAMDSKKLAARVPAWAKPKTIVSRPRFVPGLAPQYPPQSRPRPSDWAPVRSFPEGCAQGAAAYIRWFESLNGLRHA